MFKVPVLGDIYFSFCKEIKMFGSSGPVEMLISQSNFDFFE